MQPLTAEWVSKAEADLATARRELRARNVPNYDAACRHAQQCAETYLKACLQEAGVAFPRTHDLAALLSLMPAPDPALTALLADLCLHAGASADRVMTKDAVARCLAVRAA